MMHENQTYFLNVLKYTPFKFKNSWKYFTFYQIQTPILYTKSPNQETKFPLLEINFRLTFSFR